ncbi:MAG: acyl-CoA dehydrogenase family protein [Pseudomonadota bacterium]
MELVLSNADIAFRDSVREFLDKHLTDRLRAGARATPSVFVEPDLALEWQQILDKQGWLVYHWPEEFGGTGWTPIQSYLFEKECALADAPSLPVLGLRLLGQVICEFGSDAQKTEILPRIRTAEDYWCQGFSEPGAGSDLASLSTRAELRDGQYVINGSKIWTTHAHHATHIFVLARTDPTVKPQRGISFLLVDLDQPGVTIRPIQGMAGDHEVNQVFFDNAVTGSNNIIGHEGQGWTIAKFLLEHERGGSCFGPKLLADIERIRCRALEMPDGDDACLADDQVFARRLARIELAAQALETTELRILNEVANGRQAGPQTSIIKLAASNLRQEVDAAALTAAGYYGLNLETQRPLYGNGRPVLLDGEAAMMAAPRYLNSRAWTIFGGSNEVQRGIIAKTVLGL